MSVVNLFLEPSSAFDPDREMKDRKLAQIFKKLHMEQVS